MILKYDYVGMITGHLVVRVASISIKKRIQQYRTTLIFANHARITYIFLAIFLFLKHAMLNQYSTKIKKTLSIKKYHPKLNAQFYAYGSFFVKCILVHLLFCVWDGVKAYIVQLTK